MSTIRKKPADKKRTSFELATIDNTMTFGKIPPQAKKIEEAILGLILCEYKTLDTITDIIKHPEYFYIEANQRIYKAMIALRDTGKTPDLLMVVEQLKKTEELEFVGGPHYISKLTNEVTSNTRIEDYCRVVAEKYMLRQLIKVGLNIVANAYEDPTDAFDLIDFAEAEVLAINTHTKGDYKALKETTFEVMRKINDLMHSDRELTGVRAGFKVLDRLTCGWQPTDLIILAARPSVGKTAFALNLARNAATGPEAVPVGFFSMEMSTPQLIQRLLAIESGILLEKISRGKMEEPEFKELQEKGMEPLNKMKIFLDDTPALTIYELRNKARKMKSKNGVGLIIIDYLQLMSGTSKGRDDNREQEISKISRDLKGLAKELETPIIALSQLSRGPEKREVKMPVLSDLRESGAIEQDADVVMFMYRPEYYNIQANEQGDRLNGETHIKFAKHRNGALDTVKVKAQLATQRFFDLDHESVQELGKGNWVQVIDAPDFKVTKGTRMNNPDERITGANQQEEEEYKF